MTLLGAGSQLDGGETHVHPYGEWERLGKNDGVCMCASVPVCKRDREILCVRYISCISIERECTVLS